MRTNICLQNRDFGTTWAEVNARDNADTLNTAVAPDGTTTADKLIDDSGTGSGSVLYTQAMTFAISTVYTISYYSKADQLNWTRLIIGSLGALTLSAFYDLTNGVMGATVGGDVTSTFIENAKLTFPSAPDGWFRGGFTFNSDASDTAGTINIYVADANNDSSVARDGTSSIFLWGSQLEPNPFATPLIPTTTVAVSRSEDPFIAPSIITRR